MLQTLVNDYSPCLHWIIKKEIMDFYKNQGISIHLRNTGVDEHEYRRKQFFQLTIFYQFSDGQIQLVKKGRMVRRAELWHMRRVFAVGESSPAKSPFMKSQIN